MSKMPDDISINRRDVLQTAAAGGAAALGLSGGAVAEAAGMNDVTTYGERESVVRTPDRTVRIRSGGRADYEFSVTGLLTPSGAPATAVDSGTASGTVSASVHTFKFTGEFTQFDVDGDVDVTVDGEAFDPAAFPRRRLEIAPDREVSFDVSASGGVRVEGETVDRPNARRAVGDARSTVTISYEGELTYLDVEGGATLRKNGQPVESVEAALPSTRPHVARVETDGTRHGYEFEATSDAGVVSSASTETVNDGVVSGRVSGEATELRYAGRATRLKRDDGAVMEFDEYTKRVRCHAPADSDATFTMTSTDGLVRDKQVVDEPTVTVSAGETELVKYFGQVTGGSIGSLRLDLRLSAYPAAADSARLQLAAEVERSDAFEALSTAANGRVRHDAGAIHGTEVDPDDIADSSLVAVFAMAGVSQADRGSVFVELDGDGGVQEARNEYRDVSEGRTESLTLSRLDTNSIQRSPYAAEFTTQTNKFAGPDLTADRSSPPQVTPDGWLGDIWDGLTDFAGDIAGLAEDTVQSVVESAYQGIPDVSAEDIVVNSASIVCGSFAAIDELTMSILDEIEETGKIKALGKMISKTHLGIFVGASVIIDSNVFEQLGNGNNLCGVCMAAANLMVELICGAFGKYYGCSLVSFASLGLGSVACVVFLEAVCSLAVEGTITYYDAKNKVCSGIGQSFDLYACA